MQNIQPILYGYREADLDSKNKIKHRPSSFIPHFCELGKT